MTLLKKMMLAASLFLASNFASAAPYDLSLTTGSDLKIVGAASIGLFIDNFSFTLDQDSFLDQDLAYFGDFNQIEFSILDAFYTEMGSATMIGGVLSIDNLFLQAGDYVTVVAGVFDGGFGAYALATSITSPVPEASTIAMMLGGLGLVGFMAARRRKTA